MPPRLGYEPIDTSDVPPPREIQVRIEGGISATIAIPHGVDSDDPRWATPTKRMVLILHGQMGHRDYTYQKLLAYKLAAYNGLYSLRIDFRGCGALDDVADMEKGRVVELDIEDITRSMEFITNPKLNPLGVAFVPLAVVAHSRGAVVMFLWALRQEELIRAGDPERKAIRVPNLVSCSTRYNSLTMFEKGNLLDDIESAAMTCLRHGKYQLVSVPREELVTLIDVDLTCVKELPASWSVMSVYGLNDEVVSGNDGAQFSNLLSRTRHSHHLELIKHADHMFMGTHTIESEEDHKEFNPDNLPLDKKKHVNFRYHVVAAVSHWLKPENELIRFLHAHEHIGAVPRWKNIDGLFNFRDIGGWRILNPTFNQRLASGLAIYFRAGYIFRSGNVSSITNEGANALKELGVKTLFDLRSPQEIAGDIDPGYLRHAKINRIVSPVIDLERISPEVLAKKLVPSSLSATTADKVYEEILQEGVQPLRLIFNYIKDHPTEPFVISCSNGVDLTSVVVMLVLRLAGVERHNIAHEHGLSTHGLRAHSQVHQSQAIARVATNSLIANGTERANENPAVSMFRTLDALDEKFGGVLGYMKNELGFVDDEIREIYANLVTHGIKGPVSFPVAKI